MPGLVLYLRHYQKPAIYTAGCLKYSPSHFCIAMSPEQEQSVKRMLAELAKGWDISLPAFIAIVIGAIILAAIITLHRNNYQAPRHEYESVPLFVILLVVFFRMHYQMYETRRHGLERRIKGFEMVEDSMSDKARAKMLRELCRDFVEYGVHAQ